MKMVELLLRIAGYDHAEDQERERRCRALINYVDETVEETQQTVMSAMESLKEQPLKKAANGET